MQVKEIFDHPWVRRYSPKPEEPSILNQSVTDKLFDIVIERIQKKKKLNTTKLVRNEKIILKIEKETHPELRISSIKEIEDESQSMLKEIQEIGKQLDDYNTRVNRVQKNTKKLKEKFEKSSTMDFTAKNEYDQLFNSRDSVHKKKISFDIMMDSNNASEKNECSTQTENERSPSTWANFMKLFQCSN
jgi:hypothetical protein